METTNKLLDLKEVIGAILAQIIAYSGEQGLIPVPFDKLKKIVLTLNRGDILYNVNFRDVKKVYWEIVDEYEDKDFIKLHFAETYLNKGISLINEKAPRSPRNSREISDVRMPALTVEALEYRYNNDKKSFIR